MAEKPDVQDLHIMLVKLNGKIDLLLTRDIDRKEWQEKHEEADNRRFKRIEDKVGGWQKFAVSIAIVAAFIGASFDKVKSMF